MSDHCQLHRSYMKQTSKSCKAKGKINDFVVIDDDNDVIILDFPEALKGKYKHSESARGTNKWPLHGVISIDDDESDIINAPGSSNGGAADLDSGSSSPASEVLQGTSKLDDEDECQVIQEKASAFRFSKCKQTFSKASSRNRYGLYSESQRYPSESECSDCEVIEVCVEKQRELWEKAARRKKNHRSSDKYCSKEENLTTGPRFDMNHRVETEPATQCHDVEDPMCPPLHDEFVNRENISAFNGAAKRDYVGACSKQSTVLGVNGTLVGKSSSAVKPCPATGPRYTCWKAIYKRRGGTYDEQVVDSHYMNKVKNNSRDFFKSFQVSELQSDPPEADNWSKSPVCKNDHCSGETRVTAGPNESAFPAASSVSPSLTVPEGINPNGQFNEAINGNGKLYSPAGKETNPVASTSGCASDCDNRSVKGDIFIDREKLKETDEFKRAAEAEWASRQRQLQIQAEEAQRLRKKRKAESMRLLDMERRQKQRIDEIRETQKKDEENMSLKEQYRVEVRRELKVLEATCYDMASLLRHLGIVVGGSIFPSAHEVHAAYKKALLKFHPDRASGVDIRQQVEAEEKFKLISRMKEKFLFASCR